MFLFFEKKKQASSVVFSQLIVHVPRAVYFFKSFTLAISLSQTSPEKSRFKLFRGERSLGVLTTKKMSPQSSKYLRVLHNVPQTRSHTLLSPSFVTMMLGKLRKECGPWPILSKPQPIQTSATSVLPGARRSPVTFPCQAHPRGWLWCHHEQGGGRHAM